MIEPWAVLYYSDRQGEVLHLTANNERRARRWVRVLRLCNLRSLTFWCEPLHRVQDSPRRSS